MANTHRAYKAKPEHYVKPWKCVRLMGKWLKCRVCHPKRHKKNTYRRADNRRAELFLED